MELTNRTPVPAKLFLTELVAGEPRLGAVVAKATFRLEADGPVLEREEPVPLFDTDEETELGLLPRDDLPTAEEESFQVILLGTVRPAGGKPVQRQAVGLSVGHVQHTLWVLGDRRWEGLDGPEAERTISDPQPFVEMPLTWARAFGGSTDVLVDVDSPVRVSDPRNPDGRGHDPGRAAVELGRSLGSPEGYPRWIQERPLPNLEDPGAAVSGWSDAPDPYCWATVPLTSALHARRVVHIPADLEEGGRPAIDPASTHRAHPHWVIALPEENAWVRLHGVDPGGELAFRLPTVRVLADYVVGERSGARELRPRMLVLLPDQRRAYLVYRHQFTYPFREGDERSMRLRLEEGWFPTPVRSDQ